MTTATRKTRKSRKSAKPAPVAAPDSGVGTESTAPDSGVGTEAKALEGTVETAAEVEKAKALEVAGEKLIAKHLPLIVNATGNLVRGTLILCETWAAAKDEFEADAKARGLNTRDGRWAKLREAAPGCPSEKQVGRYVKVGRAMASGVFANVDMAKLPDGLTVLEVLSRVETPAMLEQAVESGKIGPGTSKVEATAFVAETKGEKAPEPKERTPRQPSSGTEGRDPQSESPAVAVTTALRAMERDEALAKIVEMIIFHNIKLDEIEAAIKA